MYVVIYMNAYWLYECYFSLGSSFFFLHFHGKIGEKQYYSAIFLWYNLLLLLKVLEGCRCYLGNEQWRFSCYYFWDCQRKSKGKIVKSRLSLDFTFYNALSISLVHRILCPKYSCNALSSNDCPSQDITSAHFVLHLTLACINLSIDNMWIV